MANIMQGGGTAAVRMFGPRPPFPRKGAWTKLDDGRLAIIYDINVTKTIDSSNPDAEPVVTREAVLHFIDDKRETQMTLVNGRAQTYEERVPAESLKPATYSDIQQHLHPTDMPPFAAALMGYELNSSQLSNLTALERAQLGKSFNDSDKAQAAIEKSKLDLEHLQRQRIAQDDEAIALEEEIEQERLAFIANVTARREAMHAKLVKKLGL